MTIDSAQGWCLIIAAVFVGVVNVVNAIRQRQNHAATAAKLDAIHRDVTDNAAN